ncbi:MAG: SagB/ThcOx family dehydrogenase [Nitrososphaerales archaeon]
MIGRRRFLKRFLILASFIAASISAFITLPSMLRRSERTIEEKIIALPKPPPISMSVEDAIQKRRSIREYKHPIDLIRLSQLLLNSFKKVGEGYGLLTAALNEVDVYLSVGEEKVVGVPAGVYLYLRDEHALKVHREGNYLKELSSAALNQPWVEEACFNIVLFANLREDSRLREGVVELSHICAGVLGEKVYLAAVGLGLACVVIGAFYEDRVKAIFEVDSAKTPLYIISVGDLV